MSLREQHLLYLSPRMTWSLIFFVSVCIVLYAYIGYALVLRLFYKKRGVPSPTRLPEITMVIPAYNEANIIERKLSNTLALHYPARVYVVVIDDGSTDDTAGRVAQYAGVTLIKQHTRSGKAAALNKALLQASTPITVFTDASAMLQRDALLQLLGHFNDPEVGGVSAEKRISSGKSAVSDAESMYWKYESFLRQTESGYHSLVGADGALYAIRTSLYKPLRNDTILDDFCISTAVCTQGYRFLYDANAIVYEAASSRVAEEAQRKIRISAGCFQALSRSGPLWRPEIHPRVKVVFFSHRVLRWVVCPFLLPIVLLANVMLVWQHAGVVYMVFLGIQTAGYLLALMGYFFQKNSSLPRWLMLPFYFVFMNTCLYAGLWRFVTKSQPVQWEKPERLHNLLM